MRAVATNHPLDFLGARAKSPISGPQRGRDRRSRSWTTRNLHDELQLRSHGRRARRALRVSGEVASVELLTRGRAQRPSGSAVVEYRYAEAAAAAVDALEGTELDGRDLRVRAYFSN